MLINSRRRFLQLLAGTAGVAAAGAVGFRWWRQPGPRYAGKMIGANSKVGHLLRDGVKSGAAVGETLKVQTVIVGGGMAGLSAAWWLKRNGYHDFVVLEMDDEVGGNSRSGENSISKYPWGAHYVPIPGPEAHYVRELFEELEIIQDYKDGLPIFDEYFLCADPHERLYFQGQWQEGLVPQHGIQADDKRQYQEFFGFIESLKTRKGADGRPVFNIPLDASSRDPAYTVLDTQSMASYMESRGWTSRYLNWYVNYSCRDDYGVPHSRVSAWAGLHYFASRAGVGANADGQTVITWPEGNGFLVKRLRDKVAEHIRTKNLVHSVDQSGGRCVVGAVSTVTGQSQRYEAQHVIYCGPRFTAKKVLRGYVPSGEKNLEFAPWLVANVSLRSKPGDHGAPLSWDNVSYYSKSLGYIVATHQDLTFNHRETVFTYYLPLDELSSLEERRAAYSKSYEDWAAIVVADLANMHPGIEKEITNIDTWLWGHGMVSPGINYLWSEQRQQMLKPFGKVLFAHTDMSGISIFEEAQYRGVEAAKQILKLNRRNTVG